MPQAGSDNACALHDFMVSRRLVQLPTQCPIHASEKPTEQRISDRGRISYFPQQGLFRPAPVARGDGFSMASSCSMRILDRIVAVRVDHYRGLKRTRPSRT